MINSTDSQAKGHVEMVSKLSHEATDALAEAKLRSRTRMESCFSILLQDYDAMHKIVMDKLDDSSQTATFARKILLT